MTGGSSVALSRLAAATVNLRSARETLADDHPELAARLTTATTEVDHLRRLVQAEPDDGDIARWYIDAAERPRDE